MIEGGLGLKAYRTQTNKTKTGKGIKKKAPTAYLPPGDGSQVSLPKSWTSVDLNVHGVDCEMESQPRDQHSVSMRPAMASASEPRGQGMGQAGGGVGWGGRMTPRGWELEFTSGWLWCPHKRPFQARL